MKSLGEHFKCDHICITLANRIIVSSTGWSQLTQAEQHILTLLIALNDYSKDILPTVRDIPVHIDSIDRLHNYRLVSVRLLGQIYVSMICSSQPNMTEFERTVGEHCRAHVEHIHYLNTMLYPRAFHETIVFDHNIRALLFVNRLTHFCVSTLQPMKDGNTDDTNNEQIHDRYRILRYFYMETVRMSQQRCLPFDDVNDETTMNEIYQLCDDDVYAHKSYFLREHEHYQILLLFDVNMPTIAMRNIAKKTMLLLRKQL
jgi:hypothetical protein